MWLSTPIYQYSSVVIPLIFDIDNKLYLFYNYALVGLDKQSLDKIVYGIFHNFKHLKASDFKQSVPVNIQKQENDFKKILIPMQVVLD